MQILSTRTSDIQRNGKRKNIEYNYNALSFEGAATDGCKGRETLEGLRCHTAMPFRGISSKDKIISRKKWLKVM